MMMKLLDFPLVLLVGAAPLAFAPLPALAQTGGQAAPAPADAEPMHGNDGLAENVANEIVVIGTAGAGMRRQEASFAVTTLSDDAIAQLAPASTADLFKAIPGVTAESSGGQSGANIFVRGFPAGGDAEFVTVQASGMPIFAPPKLSFLDNTQLLRIDETTARVEAVRGGTGALFSSGQPGLTVNFVQREGGPELEGLIKLGTSDRGGYRGDALISGPLGSDTYFMVGGFYERANGIRDPQFAAEEAGQITANLRHDLDRGSLLVYGRYLNQRGQWLLPIPVVQEGDDVRGFRGFDPRYGTLASKDVRFNTLADGRQVDLADGRGAEIINAGLNFDYEVIDGLTLRERASYLEGDANTVGLVPGGAPMSASDFAASLGGTIDSLTYADGQGAVAAGGDQQVMQAGVWDVRKEIASFTNDLSLEYKAGINTLTVGGYFASYSSRDHWSLGNNLLLTARQNARRLDMVLADGRVVTRDGFTSGANFNVNGDYDGKDYALYAVDEIQVTDKLRLDAGIRWQKHEVDGTVEDNTAPFDADGDASTLYDNGTVGLAGTFRDIRYRGDEFSYTAGANYDLTRELGVFLRYSRGNSFPFFDNLRDGIDMAPEIDSYEAGLKFSTDVLSLYATLFRNEFKGLVSTEIVNGQPLAAAGGARTNGVEIEGALRPLEGLSIAFAGTWLDAQYKDFIAEDGTDISGNQVLRQPEWQWRVTPSYTVGGPDGTTTLFATVSYLGDRFSDASNQQFLPHYYEIDAGMSFDVTPNFQFMVTGNNLTNEVGLTEGNPRLIGSQGSGVILARPILGRSFHVSAAIKF